MSLNDAVKAVKLKARAKYVETVDVCVQLGIDPKRSDQAVREFVNIYLVLVCEG